MSKRTINLTAATQEELDAIATDAKNFCLSNEDKEGVWQLMEEIHYRSQGKERARLPRGSFEQPKKCSCSGDLKLFPNGRYLVANFSQRDVVARVNYLRLHGDPDGAEDLQTACDCGDVARVRLMLSEE